MLGRTEKEKKKLSEKRAELNHRREAAGRMKKEIHEQQTKSRLYTDAHAQVI